MAPKPEKMSKREYKGRGAIKRDRFAGAVALLRAARRMKTSQRKGFRSLRGGRFRNTRTAGFLGIEYKFLDCAWNTVSINSTTDGSGGEIQPSSGCTQCLSVPAQGDGEQERDGRSYVMKSIYCSGTLAYTTLSNQADALGAPPVFLALVLDTQANGATINSEDVFINPSSVAASIMPQPLRNLQNSKRFRILDSTYVSPKGLYAGTDGASTLSIDTMCDPVFKLGWKGSIKVTTSGTSASVANATDYAIHLVAFKANDNFTITVNGKSRLRFIG